MARLPYPDPKSLDADTARLIESMGRPLNIMRMLAHSPPMLKGLVGFGGAVLGQQEFSARLRELAILRIGERSRAEYEFAQHVPIGLACGVTEGQLEALRRGDAEAACFAEEERAVLSAVDELLVAARLSDAALARLRAFLSERELVEFLMAVGFYMLVARFLATTEVEIEEGGVPGAASVDPRFRGKTAG